MRFVFIAISIFLVNLPAFSDTSSQTPLLYKKLELNFEPAQVSLLGVQSGSKLVEVEVPFKFLKTSDDETPKYIVTVVGVLNPETKPTALLFVSTNHNQEIVEASSSLIEKRDLVDSSVIAPLRENVLALRAKSVENAKQISIKEAGVNELKTRAASLARLNRLVEAQTTVSSLQRKLEGLLIDKANISLLLDIVRQEQPSARLISNEAALSRDLRLLSQEGAGSKKQKGVKLSDAQRESARKIIEKAQGLNLESLREKIQTLRNAEHALTENTVRSLPEQAADDDAIGLAEEYNRKHNLN